MRVEDPANLFGGWPFVDDTFVPRRLLAAVVALRRFVDQQCSRPVAPASPRRYLEPALARRIMARRMSGPPICARPMDSNQLTRISCAKEAICDRLPIWRNLLQLPIDYCILVGRGSISCSAPHYPQHVFFSERVFRSDAEIQEQLIHELCHNWVYLIGEGWRLSGDDDAPCYTLPTGTGQKEAGEVIGAAHVAVALYRWYAVQGEDSAGSTRRAVLLNYLEGCLASVADGRRLGPAGLLLRDRLVKEVLLLHGTSCSAGSREREPQKQRRDSK